MIKKIIASITLLLCFFFLWYLGNYMDTITHHLLDANAFYTPLILAASLGLIISAFILGAKSEQDKKDKFHL